LIFLPASCPCRKPNRADKLRQINHAIFCPMREALGLIWTALAGVTVTCFVGSRDHGPPASGIEHTEAAFAQEADVQRHGTLDLAGLYDWRQTVPKALAIVKPETV